MGLKIWSEDILSKSCIQVWLLLSVFEWETPWPHHSYHFEKVEYRCNKSVKSTSNFWPYISEKVEPMAKSSFLRLKCSSKAMLYFIFQAHLLMMSATRTSTPTPIFGVLVVFYWEFRKDEPWILSKKLSWMFSPFCALIKAWSLQLMQKVERNILLCSWS